MPNPKLSGRADRDAATASKNSERARIAAIPVVVASDGKHLGWMPNYRWTDLTGQGHVYHGHIHRNRDEAEAATLHAKPDSWVGWTCKIQPCSTYFGELLAVIRVRQTMAELLYGGADAAELAA